MDGALIVSQEIWKGGLAKLRLRFVWYSSPPSSEGSEMLDPEHIMWVGDRCFRKFRDFSQ